MPHVPFQLRYTLSRSQRLVPQVRLWGVFKTIFVLVIDTFDYPEPASKRGHLKSYELVEDELIRIVGETTPATPSAL